MHIDKSWLQLHIKITIIDIPLKCYLQEILKAFILINTFDHFQIKCLCTELEEVDSIELVEEVGKDLYSPIRNAKF